jgi:hypothetical protein
MDLEETEARNDCAGEGQQQFDLPTDRPIVTLRESEKGERVRRTEKQWEVRESEGVKDRG